MDYVGYDIYYTLCELLSNKVDCNKLYSNNNKDSNKILPILVSKRQVVEYLMRKVYKS